MSTPAPSGGSAPCAGHTYGDQSGTGASHLSAEIDYRLAAGLTCLDSARSNDFPSVSSAEGRKELLWPRPLRPTSPC